MIRLILNDQGIPYMEFHVSRSMLSSLLRNEFAAAGLADNLPYYSDGTCEMTGASTILRYIARRTGLMGETAAQSVKIDSVVEYGFAVLQSLWRVGCQCGKKQKLSEDRAKAMYFKDVVLPILRTLESLVPDYDEGKVSRTECLLTRPADGLPLHCIPPPVWIFEAVRAPTWLPEYCRRRGMASVFRCGHRCVLLHFLHCQVNVSIHARQTGCFDLPPHREFGESTLLPFANLRRHSEAVEYHRRNIRVFLDSPYRY